MALPTLDSWSLSNLCGVWRDHKGSTYALRLGRAGTINVCTTRTTGETIATQALIHERGDGRVVWGGGGGIPWTLTRVNDNRVIWQPEGASPPWVLQKPYFLWDRLPRGCQ